MKRTPLCLLISYVLLAITAVDSNVDALEMELCKLIDRSVYARLRVYDGRICYFLVKNYTAILSEEIDGLRFTEGQDMCKKHSSAHLPRIRTEEEAQFIIEHFSTNRELWVKDEPVDRIMLGLITQLKRGYVWDDRTNLTYKPDEWNGYHSGRARHSRYVVMHLDTAIDKSVVIWTSAGTNMSVASEPVALVCQLEVEGKATTVVDAALRETTAATTGDSGGSAANSRQVIALALATVALLLGST